MRGSSFAGVNAGGYLAVQYRLAKRRLAQPLQFALVGERHEPVKVALGETDAYFLIQPALAFAAGGIFVICHEVRECGLRRR